MATRNGQLENALAVLLQNQAEFVAQMTEMRAQTARLEADIAQKFASIAAILQKH